MTLQEFDPFEPRLTRIWLAAVLLVLAGCRGFVPVEQTTVPDAPQIRLKYGGREVSFEPTYARFATFKKGLILKDSDIQNEGERVSAVVHRIYLAN